MNDCGRIHEMLDRQAAGQVLEAAGAAALQEHLAGCPDCRFEVEVAASMSIDGASGPPPWADDLSRRRMVDAVVEAAGRPPLRSRAGRVLAPVGIAVLAAAAAVLLLLIVPEQGKAPQAPLEAAPLTTAAAPAAITGRVLLAARDAGTGDLFEREIAAGARLPAADGLVVVGLGEGIRLALQPGADVVVTRLDREAVSIEVSGGTLLAWVDPDKARPGFTVETPAGTIAVDGTVFSLDVAGQLAEVGVLRGNVLLSEPGMDPRRLGIGEQAVLGREGRAPLPAAAGEEARAFMALLDLLAPALDARVEIRSLPAGAPVTIDDVPLGATPLRAAIRPGYRSIAVGLPGYAPVREILEISRGEVVSRVFDLQGAKPVAAPAGAAGPSSEASSVGPAGLLAEAQALRAARDWASAAAIYDTILRRHGSSTEARSAAISSATIKLDHLRDPAGALRLFDAYLAGHGSGALAQEAAWGRCRALRALGQKTEEAAALGSFLARHPAALEAGLASKRLAQIEK